MFQEILGARQRLRSRSTAACETIKNPRLHLLPKEIKRPIVAKPDAHLHALVDLDAAVVVVVQLFVDEPQRLQTEAVVLAYAWRHRCKTGVCGVRGGGEHTLQLERALGRAHTFAYHKIGH